jgi:hypothetical protein
MDNLLKAEVKVNVIVRLLSIPLTILLLIVFAISLHDLVLYPLTFDGIIKNSFKILLMANLLWPFSYVAIKGKIPKHWHPYQ